jgi:vancomycin resistance protein VanW
MILRNGTLQSGTGGGLCQLSNLIYWMTLHTPLTVVERHRHGYDVFPDSNRIQPFGSGATCYYPHGDLMIRNDTSDTFQLIVSVGKECLEGEWRVSSPPVYRYEIVEKNYEMKGEYWGGYSRHNEIYQQVFNMEGELVEEVLAAKNFAIIMRLFHCLRFSLGYGVTPSLKTAGRWRKKSLCLLFFMDIFNLY